MNAWLITWEIASPRNSGLDKIAAILSARKSEDMIAEFVQLLYLRSTSSAADMAYYANRRKEIPFKAQKGLLINNVPHGDRILCGGSTCWLYARKIRNLQVKVDEKRQKEILSWIEPPTYKWRDGGRSYLEFASEGESQHWERRYFMPLSKDTW
jgi:hypothetical protein